ncbi:hypothetical protein A9174_19810 [Mesorhizobium loti NZP2037]|nr:hypothetical protein A9174_19810 [Mesorhizobium loti NZP2037]
MFEHFPQVIGGKSFQQNGALRGDGDQHAATIGERRSAFRQTRFDQSVDELHSSIRLKQKLLSKILDHHGLFWMDLDREQGLILLRCNTDC